MTAADVRLDMVEEVLRWLHSQRAVIRQGFMQSPTYHQARRTLPLARAHEIAEALSRYRLAKLDRRSPQRVPTRSPKEIADDRKTVRSRKTRSEKRKAARLSKAVAEVERHQRLLAARAREEAMLQADIEKAKCREEERAARAAVEPKPWEKPVPSPAPVLRGPKRPPGWSAASLPTTALERRRAALEAAKRAELNRQNKE